MSATFSADPDTVTLRCDAPCCDATVTVPRAPDTADDPSLAVGEAERDAEARDWSTLGETHLCPAHTPTLPRMSREIALPLLLALRESVCDPGAHDHATTYTPTEIRMSREGDRIVASLGADHGSGSDEGTAVAALVRQVARWALGRAAELDDEIERRRREAREIPAFEVRAARIRAAVSSAGAAQ